MAHSVSETAARAVKNSQRKIEETRTDEQIIKDLRLNVKSRLYVAPLDIELVLAKLDGAVQENTDLKTQVATMVTLQEEIARLKAQIAEFRDVYEQENQSMAVKMERVAGPEILIPGVDFPTKESN